MYVSTTRAIVVLTGTIIFLCNCLLMPFHAWLTRPNAMQCLVLTRLVEEGLSNVVRHSHPQHVWLRLTQDSQAELCLEIEDDGVGFDIAAVRQSGLSVGMRSMTTRIARLHGTLSGGIRTRKNGADCSFPLEPSLRASSLIMLYSIPFLHSLADKMAQDRKHRWLRAPRQPDDRKLRGVRNRTDRHFHQLS